MRLNRILFLLVLVLFLAYGCKKEIEGEDVAYTGYWNSGPGVIQIYQDGRAFYNYSDGSTTEELEGRVIIKDGQLKIKALLKSKKFNIDTEPSEAYCPDSAQYTFMVLDGENYYRDGFNPCEN